MLARMLIGLSLSAGALLLVSPQAAFADDPVDLGGAYVLDDSGILSSGEEADVRDALDRLFEQTGAKVFVVYVDSFENPSDGQAWALDSAELSGLGSTDLLVAIATQDRNFGVDIGADFPLSDADIDTAIDDDLIPALRGDDWAGGPIAFADSLIASQAPSPVPAIIGGLTSIVAWYFEDWSIAIITLIIAALYAVFQYFMATRQTLALAGAHEIQKADNPRLYRVVENLAITEGMPTPKVYLINDPAPNAFATGRDPEHAVVAATTGLLEIMNDQELEGVMAHEMGHVKNYDIRVSLIVFGLVIAIGLIADIIFRMIFWGGRSRNSNIGGPAFLVVIAIGLVAAILAPIVAGVVQAAVSRQREYLADATSSLTTRNPEGLASALEKLGQYGRPVQRTNTSMSHLWISDPNRPGFLSKLFSTHPPLVDRIARLRNNATKF